MKIKPTLYEQLKWDEGIDSLFESSEVPLDESTLSKLIGKKRGGQLLVQWLHRRHKLSNEADLIPASFSERIFWKQFKSNPDDFVIVSARGGVAGIKPSAEYIKHMTDKFAKKGKVYNPSGDSGLQYQIVVFTDDGKQLDPKLFQKSDDGNDSQSDDAFISSDPTVIKSRMGLHNGRDIQNPDNIFNLLAEQLGDLITVWISGFENVKGGEPGKGSVERDKMAVRSQYKAGPKPVSDAQAIGAIYSKIRTILPKIVDQAQSYAASRLQQVEQGSELEAQFLNLKTKLAGISDDIKRNDEVSDIDISKYIKVALQAASGARIGSKEYSNYVNNLVNGKAAEFRPLIDALRTELIKI